LKANGSRQKVAKETIAFTAIPRFNGFRNMALRIQGSFLRHKDADIPRWARSLKHVRFCHPADRMVLDREVFLVVLEIPETETAFLDFCSHHGIPVNRIEGHDQIAQKGVSYKPDVWKKLKFPIPQFPNLAQPGDQTLAGAPAHLWVRGRFLEIVIGPAVGPYSVDESDYKRAKAIDDLLSGSDLNFSDPPRDDDSCVSPKHYPQYWKET
jgi:hypothetical protein